MTREAEIKAMIANVMQRKACKLVSAEQGLPDCLSPKACLRQAYAAGWIKDEATWLEMLDARNRMAHTYDVRRALEIHESLPKYGRAQGNLSASKNPSFPRRRESSSLNLLGTRPSGCGESQLSPGPQLVTALQTMPKQ